MRKIDREALEKAWGAIDDLRKVRREVQESIYELRTLDPRLSGQLESSLPLIDQALVKLAGN